MGVWVCAGGAGVREGGRRGARTSGENESFRSTVLAFLIIGSGMHPPCAFTTAFNRSIRTHRC